MPLSSCMPCAAPAKVAGGRAPPPSVSRGRRCVAVVAAARSDDTTTTTTTSSGSIGRRGAALALALMVAPGRAGAKQPAGDWSSPGLATPVDDEAPRFFKTPSGVKIQELSRGAGPIAEAGEAAVAGFNLPAGQAGSHVHLEQGRVQARVGSGVRCA